MICLAMTFKYCFAASGASVMISSIESVGRRIFSGCIVI